MKYHKKFLVKPGEKVKLKDFDPSYKDDHEDKESALGELTELQKRMDDLQFRLYAEQKRSLLICLQAMDAGGKDGVIRHVMGAMNPQNCRVISFKQPSHEELAHDYLWRIEKEAPRRGDVVIFNRSHYEDVLTVRVHDLVPEKVWSKRYDQINAFEDRLVASGTHILKFFLHISKEEQLARFKERLNDPERQWKISEADYTERQHWDEYVEAFEDALSHCSTKEAPWFVIPANHKWFRNLAISHIVVHALEKMNIQVPKPTVDLGEIRKKYHKAAAED